MTPPLSHTATQLYDALAPLAWDDENQGWALAHLCQALALSVDEVADLTRDQDDQPGYAALWDVDEIPEKYLAWVGQFVGVDVPDALPESAKRLRIRETAGWKRGTPGAIRGAARQHLTGNGTVFLVERHGSAYKISVTTLISETPDPALVESAVRAQIPAGLVFTFSTVNGASFETLRTTHMDFADVRDMFVSFAEVKASPAKQYTYTDILGTYSSYNNLLASFTDYNDVRTAS